MKDLFVYLVLIAVIYPISRIFGTEPERLTIPHLSTYDTLVILEGHLNDNYPPLALHNRVYLASEAASASISSHKAIRIINYEQQMNGIIYTYDGLELAPTAMVKGFLDIGNLYRFMQKTLILPMEQELCLGYYEQRSSGVSFCGFEVNSLLLIEQARKFGNYQKPTNQVQSEESLVTLEQKQINIQDNEEHLQEKKQWIVENQYLETVKNEIVQEIRQQDFIEQKPIESVEKLQEGIEEKPLQTVDLQPQQLIEDKPTQNVEKQQEVIEEEPIQITQEQKPLQIIQEQMSLQIIEEHKSIQSVKVDQPLQTIQQIPFQAVQQPQEVIKEKPLQIDDEQKLIYSVQLQKQQAIENKPLQNIEDNAIQNVEVQQTLQTVKQQQVIEQKTIQNIEEKPIQIVEEYKLPLSMEAHLEEAVEEKPKQSVDQPQQVDEDNYVQDVEEQKQTQITVPQLYEVVDQPVTQPQQSKSQFQPQPATPSQPIPIENINQQQINQQTPQPEVNQQTQIEDSLELQQLQFPNTDQEITDKKQQIIPIEFPTDPRISNQGFHIIFPPTSSESVLEFIKIQKQSIAEIQMIENHNKTQTLEKGDQINFDIMQNAIGLTLKTASSQAIAEYNNQNNLMSKQQLQQVKQSTTSETFNITFATGGIQKALNNISLQMNRQVQKSNREQIGPQTKIVDKQQVANIDSNHNQQPTQQSQHQSSMYELEIDQMNASQQHRFQQQTDSIQLGITSQQTQLNKLTDLNEQQAQQRTIIQNGQQVNINRGASAEQKDQAMSDLIQQQIKQAVNQQIQLLPAFLEQNQQKTDSFSSNLAAKTNKDQILDPAKDLGFLDRFANMFS